MLRFLVQPYYSMHQAQRTKHRRVCQNCCMQLLDHPTVSGSKTPKS